MDSPTQPSFIPHDAVTASGKRPRGGGLAELGILVGILLLIVSGALAAGVFLYSQYLQASGKSKLDQLNRAEQSIDPTFVEQMTRLDTQMHVAQSLITAHLAPVQLFAALEASTVQDIEFTAFQYDATDPSKIKITMSGTAGSINAIALQARVFTQSGIFVDPIFSGVDRQPDGVRFQFTGYVKASAMNYESLVNGSAQGAAAAQPETLPTAPANSSVFNASSTPSAGQ